MAVNTIKELTDKLTIYNEAYRRGHPLVSDPEYDALVERLRQLDPGHPFLKQVEPEIFSAKRKIKHAQPMLSILKAYTCQDVERYVARVEKAAGEIGETDILFRVTAKLDGVAGYDNGIRLVTRGDGLYGFDVTNAFDKGIVAVGGRGGGLGEIVIVKSYFDTHLADRFEHPRNLVVGIIGSDQVNKDALSALADGAVRFVPYDRLPDWHGAGKGLIARIDAIYDRLLGTIDYPVDGIVAQVVAKRLRDHMGATANHHRWQVAYKKRGEAGVTAVKSITWQVGRTGNITPVLEVEPIRLSGATIQRVTAHHAGMIRKMCVGPGASIELIRSGEVIPKLESVISGVKTVDIPRQCPSCGTILDWKGDFLRCPNQTACRDQIVGRLHHWFHILGNADWFGVKTIEKLVDGGINSLSRLYAATIGDYESLGFGPVQSRNLADAVTLSRTQEVEDWRFLAAFGISSLGVGESRKLLACYSLEALWDVGWKQVAEIKGFGEIKSRAIMGGLGDHFENYCEMLGLGFQLIRTPLATSADMEDQSVVSGKGVVFTGKMNQGSRSDMQAMARRLGAKVQTRVSGATDMLVCGDHVGAKKMETARRKGIQIMTELEFLDLIGVASE